MCCKLRPVKASLSHSYSKVVSSSVEYDSTCVSFSNRWQSAEVSSVSLFLYLLLCVFLWVAVNGILCFICVFSWMVIIPHTSTLTIQNGGLSRFRWACRSFERQRTRATLTCFKIQSAIWTVLNVQEWDYFIFLKQVVRFWLAAQTFSLMGRKYISMILHVIYSVYD